MQDTNPSKHRVSCTLDAASESCSLCQHLAASLDRQTARLHKATLFHWPKCSLIRTVTSTGLATTFTSALSQQLFHNLLLHLLQHSLHPVRSIAAFIAGCEAHSAFFAAHKVCCRIIAACKVYCSCMSHHMLALFYQWELLPALTQDRRGVGWVTLACGVWYVCAIGWVGIWMDGWIVGWVEEGEYVDCSLWEQGIGGGWGGHPPPSNGVCHWRSQEHRTCIIAAVVIILFCLL